MPPVGIFSRRTAATSTALAVPESADVVVRDRMPREYRSPSVSTLTPTGARAGRAMINSDFDAAKSIREHYLCNVYLYAAVQALGEDLASLTLRCGPDPDKPQDYNPEHPLILRLGPAGRPNPQTTARQLWQWTVAQFTVTGKFAWEIDKSDTSFWPLISTRVHPQATNGGDRYFSSFNYEVGQGQSKNLPADRVIYHWRPSVTDWRQPESVLQSARLDLSVAVMQDLYDFAFLQNDARPAAVVVHEGFDDDDERDAWRRQFLDTHRGAGNAGKVAFAQTSPDGAPASESLFVQTLGLSQKDAEFIKRYESKIRSILISIGVPLTRLGDASARTFANADEEMKAYWKNKVRQLAINFADAINQYVAPLYGTDKVWWDFSENEYLREPPSIGVYEGIAAFTAGIMTREEVRIEALGLPEEPKVGAYPVLPDATVHDPDATIDAPVTAGALAAVVRAEITAALAQWRAEQPAPLPLPAAPPLAALPPVIEVTAAETPDEARARRARQWRSFASTTGPLERRWGKRWQRLFDAQLESVTSRLNGKRGRQAFRSDDGPDVDALFDDEFWFGRTQDLATDMYEEVLGASFAAFDGSVGIAFDVEAPFARGFIETRANQLAGRVTTTTYDAIKSQLADGALAGESIPDIAARIEGLFAQTYSNRAVTVARTEVISGYNGGTLEAAMQTDGLVESMEWIATSDDRTRDDHADADGQIVPLGDSFSVGDEDLEYPGDPNGSPENVINCRCTTAAVVSPDRAAPGAGVNMAMVQRLAVAIARGDCTITDERSARRALAGSALR